MNHKHLLSREECDLSTTFIRYHLYEKIVEMVDGFMIGQVPLKSWGGLSDQKGPERPLGAPWRCPWGRQRKSGRGVRFYGCCGFLWVVVGFLFFYKVFMFCLYFAGQ